MKLLFTLFLFPLISFAEDLLIDQNSDGLVTIIGFGDSISFGTGDGTAPGAFVSMATNPASTEGYLKRVRELAGLPTINLGNPGEFLTGNGIARFPGALLNNSADIVVILEGSNDASFASSSNEFRFDLQQAINIAKALNYQPILMTILPPCCGRAEREPFTRDFSKVVRDIASLNDVPLVDIEKVWDTSCQNQSQCEFYSLPEGLHPNTLGYDVIAQAFLATLYGIDIFATSGASELASAIGLQEENILVKPIPVVQ